MESCVASQSCFNYMSAAQRRFVLCPVSCVLCPVSKGITLAQCQPEDKAALCSLVPRLKGCPNTRTLLVPVDTSLSPWTLASPPPPPPPPTIAKNMFIVHTASKTEARPWQCCH